MMQYGLLGGKLSHSFSPQIHAALASYPYALYETKPEELDPFFRSTRFSGINVTIPYKKAVLPYCHQLTPIAARLGSVNTIVRQKDGRLIGHNTDYFGFETMLHRSGLQVNGKKVLVLGSGGAAVTACAVLQSKGANVIVISRTGKNHYQNLHLHADAAVIVNATPVGMYPDVGISPVDIHQFPQLEGVLDLIYNPARTKLLLDAEQRGLVAMNGLVMLIAQAKESAEWFTGKKIPDSKIDEIHRMIRLQTENLILIGMPGCGKSTIGKTLAERLHLSYCDVDEAIVGKAHLSIPEIFENGGEAGFRALETQLLTEICRRSGQVIATGGGCVTREENYPLLHQNGIIIWIQRPLESLPKDGRPLSQTCDLSFMYQHRCPMYQRFADITVSNNTTLEDTVAQILHQLEESI
jgi:shikimate dehydrogenase